MNMRAFTPLSDDEVIEEIYRHLDSKDIMQRLTGDEIEEFAFDVFYCKYRGKHRSGLFPSQAE